MNCLVKIMDSADILTTSRSKRIRWMVEWIHGDGSKRLSHMIENEPIANGYRAMVEPKEPRPSKKRKLPSESEGTDQAVPQIKTLQKDQPHQAAGTVAEVAKLEGQNPAAEHTAKQEQNLAPDPAVNEVEDAKVDTVMPKPDMDPEIREDQTVEKPPDSLAGLHFYLLMAQTPGKHTVLIPVSPQITLADAIRGRVILEFPTIYVLSQGPEELPEPFILESTYLKISKETQEEVQEFFGSMDSLETTSGGKVDDDLEKRQPDLDPRQVLDTLAKEIGIEK